MFGSIIAWSCSFPEVGKNWIADRVTAYVTRFAKCLVCMECSDVWTRNLDIKEKERNSIVRYFKRSSEQTSLTNTATLKHAHGQIHYDVVNNGRGKMSEHPYYKRQYVFMYNCACVGSNTLLKHHRCLELLISQCVQVQGDTDTADLAKVMLIRSARLAGMRCVETSFLLPLRRCA